MLRVAVVLHALALVRSPATAQPTPTLSSANNVITAALNGSGWYSLPSLPSLGNAVTLEAWVYPKGSPNWGTIIELGNGFPGDTLSLGASYSQTGGPTAAASNGGSWLGNIISPMAIPRDAWSHIAFTVGSDNVMRLYIHGQLVVSGNASGSIPSVTRSSNLIGRSNNPNIATFDGSVAEARIWSVARTQAEIQAAMPVGSITGPTTGLVASYPFGSMGYGVLTDGSANSRNLTQYGAVEYRKLGTGTVLTTLISGSSSLRVSAGQLNLNGANLFTGGTTVDAGTTLYLAEKKSLSGNVTVGSGATLRVGGWDSLGYDSDPPYVTSVTVNGGKVVMEGGPNQSASTDFVLNEGRITGSVNWSLYSSTPANNSASVTTTASANSSIIDASTMQFLQQSVTFDVADGAAATDLAVSTVASGAGALVKAGAGLMVLSGNNTYSGGTTVSGGTLQVGASGTTGTLGTGNVANNATLAFNRSDTLTVANAISGTGALVQSGTGTVTLSGANTYSGPTTVGAGTLALSGSGTLGTSSTITVAAGARLDASARTTALSLASSQTLANSGGSALIVGNLDAQAGTLSVATDGATPGFTISGGTLTVGAGTFLRLNKTGSALGAGSYKLIGKGTGGTVAGVAPGVVAVDGSGLASGMGATAQISGGELYLHVAAPTMTSAANNHVAIAAGLNGSGWFSLPSFPSLGNAVTLEAWVYPKGSPNWGTIIELGNGFLGETLILGSSYGQTGGPTAWISGSGSWLGNINSPVAIPRDAWSHIAFTVGSDNVMRLYINGQLVISGNASGPIPSVTRSSNLIGRSNNPNVPTFDGSVAEARIWNVARTQAQIQAGMAVGSVSSSAAGLVSMYPFGATGYDILNDMNGGARNLSQIGSVAYEKLGSGGVLTGISSGAAYRYYRFVPTALRGGSSADAIQLGEFQMLLNGNRLSGATASNPGGNNTSSDYNGSKANDNNPITKWFDTTKINPLVLDFGTPVVADAYRLATAYDVPDRDPIGWRIEGSLNNTSWVTLDARLNHPFPIARSAYVDALALGSTLTVSQGSLTLSGSSPFVRTTMVGSSGRLVLWGSGALPLTTNITLATGAALDVTGRTAPLDLSASQAMASAGGGASLAGNINVEAATLAPTLDDTGASFVISGGSLGIGANTKLVVHKIGASLGVGTYALVGKGQGGTVSGLAPASATITGGGLAAGTMAVPALSNGELVLRVFVPVPTTMSIGGLSQTYDGTARPVTVTTDPPNVPVTVTYNGSAVVPTNAGTYVVAVSTTELPYTGSATASLVVAKKSATIRLGNLIQPFNGKARPVIGSTDPFGLSWNVTYNGSPNIPTNVGIYSVVAAITDPNHVGSAFAQLRVNRSDPNARPPASPQPPAFLNHQGFLDDAAGNPLGSPNPRNYDLVFRVFAAESGGSPLWSESQSVAVYNGRYAVQLGDGMSVGVEPQPSLADVLAFGVVGARYLEVTVKGLGTGGSDIVMNPRFQLLSQPFSFLSLHSITADALANSQGTPVLRSVGSSVGINVESPSATLDVGGTIIAGSLRADDSMSVSGLFNASSFVGGGTIPLGGIVIWSGTVPPPGWALCDGRMVNGRTTPNLTARFVLGEGQGQGLTRRSIGDAGGQSARTIDVENMPSHGHQVDPPAVFTSQNESHGHFYRTASVSEGVRPFIHPFWQSSANLEQRPNTHHVGRSLSHEAHAHLMDPKVQLLGAGGNQSFVAMPPHFALAYIMRVQ